MPPPAVPVVADVVRVLGVLGEAALLPELLPELGREGERRAAFALAVHEVETRKPLADCARSCCLVGPACRPVTRPVTRPASSPASSPPTPVAARQRPEVAACPPSCTSLALQPAGASVRGGVRGAGGVGGDAARWWPWQAPCPGFCLLSESLLHTAVSRCREAWWREASDALQELHALCAHLTHALCALPPALLRLASLHVHGSTGEWARELGVGRRIGSDVGRFAEERNVHLPPPVLRTLAPNVLCSQSWIASIISAISANRWLGCAPASDCPLPCAVLGRSRVLVASLRKILGHE